jgi:hypothetical protein
MSGRRVRRLVSSGLIGVGAAGVAIGLCLAVVARTIADPQTAAAGSAVATSVAVIVALTVGLIPWFIAKNDRKTRSAVIASRIAHDLEIALRTAATIRDGIGHAAETADAKRIQASAKRCLPRSPETLDETFDKLSALPYDDALVVCAGVMAAIDQYVGTWGIANLDLDEAFQAFRMQIVSDNNGTIPDDLDDLATRMMGKELMQLGRRAAARAMEAQTHIQSAIETLKRHGALTPRVWPELFESPVPEVAMAVRQGTWPPASDAPIS